MVDPLDLFNQLGEYVVFIFSNTFVSHFFAISFVLKIILIFITFGSPCNFMKFFTYLEDVKYVFHRLFGFAIFFLLPYLTL